MEDKESFLETIRKATGASNVEILETTDSFDFKCQQCGRCCMNREDIILNPFDVFNGARFLGITPKEFIDNNCKKTLGGTSKIPMLLLKTTDNGFCPLLKLDVKDGGKFKCTINPAKPGTCSNHPLGVTWSTNKTTGEKNTTFIKVDQCDNSKGHNHMNLVSDWVKSYIDHVDEIDAAHDISLYMNDFFDPRYYYIITAIIVGEENEDSMPEQLKKNFLELKSIVSMTAKMITSATFEFVYEHYDITRPFIEQVEENKKELTNIYNAGQLLYNKLKDFLEKAEGKPIEEVLANFN